VTTSRFLRLGRVHKLAAGTYAKAPTGDVFVKAALKKGLLPEILEELLGARKRCGTASRLAQDHSTCATPFLHGSRVTLAYGASMLANMCNKSKTITDSTDGGDQAVR